MLPHLAKQVRGWLLAFQVLFVIEVTDKDVCLGRLKKNPEISQELHRLAQNLVLMDSPAL